MTSHLRRFLLLLSMVLLSLGLPLGLWFLFQAQTATGRLLAGWGILTSLLPALVLWRSRRPSRKKRTLILAGSLWLILTAGIVLRTPTGTASADSPVRRRFTDSQTFSRFALTNIVPEAEQVNLGFRLMPVLDPLLTVAQARRVRPQAMALYAELEQDENFHALGSAMGWAYADLWGRPSDSGHYYLYVPQNRGDDPLPTVIFLHGSAGNFKAYLWLWSQLAEEQGFVVIAPSFGFGNWRQDGGIETILAALADAQTGVSLDETRIYLAGLSNGGLGVSLAAQSAPEQFAGLVFLSPVFDTGAMRSPAFLQNWRERPILIISGAADKRIPVSYVRENARFLQNQGVDMTEIIYPHEDHFLLFSQPESIFDDIKRWLQDN